MNLYELSLEIAVLSERMEIWAEEHEGDVSEFPGLECLEVVEVERDEKILGLAAWTKNLDSEAEAIKAEVKRLTDRARALTARSERVQEWVGLLLGPGRKLADGRCALSWRRSSQVVITCNPQDLPAEFQKVTVEAKKADLKTALKSGKTVDNVQIIEKNNLQIK